MIYYNEKDILIVKCLSSDTLKEYTEDEFMEKYYSDITYVIDPILPEIFEFRDAWYLSNGEVLVNAEKSVTIMQNKIRAWRTTKLTDNDILIQNALIDEDSEAKAKAVAYRDYLRDLPQQCVDKSCDELLEIFNGKLEYEEFIAKEIPATSTVTDTATST